MTECLAMDSKCICLWRRPWKEHRSVSSLFDGGSQKSYIEEDLKKRLALKAEKTECIVSNNNDNNSDII